MHIKDKQNLLNINYGQNGILNQNNNSTKIKKIQNITSSKSLFVQFHKNAFSSAELMAKEIDKKIGKNNNMPTDTEEKLNQKKTTELNDINNKEIKFQKINSLLEIKKLKMIQIINQAILVK